MSQTGSTSRTVGSLDSSNDSTVGSTGRPKDFGKKHRKIIRILTVVAYIMSVSTAALLLSAYYVFLWKPSPSEPVPPKRPTDIPYFTSANYAYGSAYNKHTSSALHSPYPSDIPRANKGSKKAYSHKTPTPKQMPTPASLIMDKILNARSTTTPLRAPASPPDDPDNPTFRKTTPNLAPIEKTTPKAFVNT